MNSDRTHRTPDEIERDIERERAGLTHTLDTLQERFSIEGIVHQVGDQLRENGGEIGRSVAQSVKQNPLALAVTGVGLAWLIFGNGRSAPENRTTDADLYRDHDPADRVASDRPQSHFRPRPATTRPAYESYGRNGAQPGPHDVNERSNGIAKAPRYRVEPEWARRDAYASGANGHANDSHDDSGSSLADKAASARDSIASGASKAGSKVSDAASKAGSTVTDAAAKAGNAVSGAASSVASGVSSAATGTRDAVSSAGRSVADAARSGRDIAAAGLATARESIAQGTESLSEAARERVIAARRRAIAARQEADRAFRRAQSKASDFYEEQPLVAGLLAMAAGAALAGALPRSRVEDDYLGEHSDALMEEAERIFREETEKAKAIATTAAEEAKKIGRETKDDLDSGAPGQKSAAEAVSDKVKSDVKRVADAAKKEAEKQNLGKVKS